MSHIEFRATSRLEGFFLQLPLGSWGSKKTKCFDSAVGLYVSEAREA